MPGRRARAAFHRDATIRNEISETRAGTHFGATQHRQARNGNMHGSGCDAPCRRLTYRRRMDMSRHMSERTTVRLPKDLLARAKRKAAVQGRTLTSLIEEGLRLVVAESKKAGKAKRVLPPVSKATGGLMPGIDLTDISDLQEIDDLAYVARMKQLK
jgi:predicted HicB family RNase H-like nuclease